MLKEIEGVLFDLDGTLIDSMGIWKEIDEEYLGRYGLTVPEGMKEEIEGMGFTETAIYFKSRFELKDSIEQIKKDWLDLTFEFYTTQVALKEGVFDFLNSLKARRIPLGIATSNSIELAKAALKSHGILEYFETVCTSCDVKKGKPSPDIYLKASGSIGVPPSKCLVFEDVPMGIIAGKTAGMKVCAIADKHSVNQEAKIRSLADYYITDYHQISLETYEVLGHE
jgi:HAD superfamily hydrolase (TIGR01509 family)